MERDQDTKREKEENVNSVMDCMYLLLKGNGYVPFFIKAIYLEIILDLEKI